METVRVGTILAVGLAVLGATLGATRTVHAYQDQGIIIGWWKGRLADDLAQMAREFTQQTGIGVTVRQFPWPEYYDLIHNRVWPDKSKEFDILLGDSQWLGKGAVQGHYVDLTEWAEQHVPWSDILASARRAYCEYEGRIYGVPCVGDALGFAYRKDLFENAGEQQAFRSKYGYDLAPPKTWAQFRDIAEFFTRPERNLYGAAIYYAGPPAYDDATMAFDQILWCFGGELADPKTGVVEGVINSPRAVAALEFYARELKKFTPPGGENYGLDSPFEPFASGKVAMAQNWYPFFPVLLDPAKNPYSDRIGFFMSPAGPAGHFISLGGQGMSLSSYSEKKDLARAFLAWFSKQETQEKWARLGGLTTHRSVLESPEFLKLQPFNPAYAASVPLLRDFYNIPEYNELLGSTQRHLQAAIKGTETPKEALDAIAREHTEILKQAGRLK